VSELDDINLFYIFVIKSYQMQHSIKFIAEQYSEISEKRQDKKRFISQDFINFAKDNKEKYSLIESGEDLLVSTWYSDDLINDYRKTL
jgi:hypothetical protein